MYEIDKNFCIETTAGILQKTQCGWTERQTDKYEEWPRVMFLSCLMQKIIRSVYLINIVFYYYENG